MIHWLKVIRKNSLAFRFMVYCSLHGSAQSYFAESLRLTSKHRCSSASSLRISVDTACAVNMTIYTWRSSCCCSHLELPAYASEDSYITCYILYGTERSAIQGIIL